MRSRAAALGAVVAATAATLSAQTAAPQQSGYLTPPKHIVDIMTAEPLPLVSVSHAR